MLAWEGHVVQYSEQTGLYAIPQIKGTLEKKFLQAVNIKRYGCDIIIWKFTQRNIHTVTSIH